MGLGLVDKQKIKVYGNNVRQYQECSNRAMIIGTIAIASCDKLLNSLTKLFELYFGRNRLKLGQVDYM